MVTGRRVFLKSLFASALSLPLVRQASAGVSALAHRRHGRFFVVNGWVLTRTDVEELSRIAGADDIASRGLRIAELETGPRHDR